MRTSRKLTKALLAMCALAMMSVSAIAADPGDPYPAASELSDQKAGSILVYPVYTSSSANPAAQNTVMNITNTSSTSSVFVHLFFIANTCSVADRFLCLTAQQTSAIDAFAEDPGITGYLIAIASDGVIGCPNSFNFLIGDEYAKFNDGFFGSLGAEAFAALYQGLLPGCDANSVFATIGLGGLPTGYNRAGLVLAVSSVGSRLDNTFHRVVVDSLLGTLINTVNNIGNIFVILYDESEASYSSTLTAGCQLIGVLGDANFPRTTPRFERIIPANSTGWLKFWSTSQTAIIGAVFTRNSNAATDQSAFNGARTLHKLTLGGGGFTMPIFPPTC